MIPPHRSKVARALIEATSLLRTPQRVFPLIQKLASDTFHISVEQRHLYSYTKSKRQSAEVLNAVVRWILDAQRDDGGIAAYYSLLTGYSKSYPEVTGYIVPTLYDFARATGNHAAYSGASRAEDWLRSLQLSTGAFPGGLHGSAAQASVFNTGQILHGLVRAHVETGRSEILRSAVAAGDWLVQVQQPDGSWSGAGAYQNIAHTYYTMVAWSLAELAAHTNDNLYAAAAEKNLDWALSHFRPCGWVDGINLQGHPNYLHFIAYVLQGILECAILRQRSDAIELVAKSSWILLRKFETHKALSGEYETDFKGKRQYSCLTGNAQMACIWLRLFEVTDDLRYLNAALKMNEMLKQLISLRGPREISGGVSGSYPIWEKYQPLRYISWGGKFFADALLLEDRLKQSYAATGIKVLQCAS